MTEDKKNQFKCSGDCLNCRVNPNERKTQWQYCAAQFTYNSMRMIEALHGELKEIQGSFGELREKIEAIQNNEADVFAPTQEEDLESVDIPAVDKKQDDVDISQEGDGE